MSFWLFHLSVKTGISTAYRERNSDLPEEKQSIYQCLFFKFPFAFPDFPPCNTKKHTYVNFLLTVAV